VVLYEVHAGFHPAGEDAYNYGGQPTRIITNYPLVDPYLHHVKCLEYNIDQQPWLVRLWT